MKHLKRFLTKVIVRTKNEEWANKSIFQFKAGDQEGEYVSTVLGVINGPLPLLPGHPVLVMKVDDESQELVGLTIKKRWW